VFWLAVIVGVDAEEVSDDTVAVVDDVEIDDTTVVGACRVVDWSAVVVDAGVEDVASAVVAEGTRRGLVVVEDETAVPKTLSSAALVQAWPLISDTATRRT